jgi:hypothetical protein
LLWKQVINFVTLLRAVNAVSSAPYSYNRLQFMLHANCDAFVSVQARGGSGLFVYGLG